MLHSPSIPKPSSSVQTKTRAREKIYTAFKEITLLIHRAEGNK